MTDQPHDTEARIIQWIAQATERADRHGNTEGVWLFAKQWRLVLARLSTPDPAAQDGREAGPPCALCGKPVEVGQVVLCWDDAGEIHADCANPFSLSVERQSDSPEPVVLLGSPMRHYPLAALARSDSAQKGVDTVETLSTASGGGEREALTTLCERVFLAAHSDGWTGNQLRRDVQHVDAAKSWGLYVSHGALAKSIEATTLAQPATREDEA